MSDNKHGFKAYEPGLICRGHQYEEGKEYVKPGKGICVPGVTHYCVNPFDVLDYYPLVRKDGKFSDFTTVEALGDTFTDDNKKFATNHIKIGAKLGFDGFVKACVDFLFERTVKDMPSSKVDTGDAAQIGSSGDAAQIGSSGYYAQIGSSGNYAKIGSSGNAAQIGSSGYAAQIGSSGYAAQIGSSGNAAQITCEGKNAVVAAIGMKSKIKAPVGAWITLAEYGDWNGICYPCLCVKSAQIDGEALKPNVFYMLKGGDFVEVEE